MKKETTNTFEGGMIKDLHPLTTPNNVLTDALNATFITYNGNESILQNDMGNVRLLHAKLPPGYVPIGMKEHGGIIYVAAYNPKTKKGLIGSFPSPLQLWEGTDWNVNKPDNNINSVSINLSDFYSGYKIINEIVKSKLFTSNSGTRVFHPGDKFVIKFPAKTNETLVSNILAGNLTIQLGVVKSDGSIEIMRTWSKENNDSSFLYGGNSVPSGVLNDKLYCLVFDASSSGELIMIITLHTLDSFNVIRKYSLDNQNKIQVDFTGEATRNGELLKSTDDSDFFRIVEESSIPNLTTLITKKSTNAYNSGSSLGITEVTIYPTVPFGVIERMKKTIKVDFDKIKKNKDDFSEWRFFVTDTYVKIGWAYDFYNLDGDKEIDYIKMYFHQLEDGYDRSKAKQYEFQKEYYSGNFEDYISISDTGLKYKTVYIVEVVKKFKDSNIENIICFKMLYLSKLYNSMYNNFFNNTSIGISGLQSSVDGGEYTCIGNTTIGLAINAELQTKLTSTKAKVKIPGSDDYGTLVNIEELSSSNYIKTIDLSGLNTIQTGNSNKSFITNVSNTYECTLKMVGTLTEVNEDIIGTPGLSEYNLINLVLSRTSNAYNGCAATIDSLEWQKSTESYNIPSLSNYTSCECPIQSTSVVDNYKNTKFNVVDDRFICGSMSDLLTTTQEAKGLVPLYSPDYNIDKKNSIAPYWKQDQMQCIAGEGDDRKTMHYNTTVMHNGSLIEGPDAGAGCDSDGLTAAASHMNNPMTSLFVGIRGDNAEMEFRKLTKQSNASSNLGLTDDGSDFGLGGNCIVEQNDDYMIACWKFTDGSLGFVNLITKRDGTKIVNNERVLKTAEDAWPRVDVMLRCILSQLFVVDKITKSITYIAPNSSYYAYLKALTKCSFIMLYNTSNAPTYDDVMYSNVKGSDNEYHTLTWWLTHNWDSESLVNKSWRYANGKITVNGQLYDMENLIPKVALNLPFNNENKITFDFTLPELYDLDPLLSNYIGIQYIGTTSNDDNLDVKNIYSIDTSKTTANTLACDSPEGLKPMLDGAFRWKTTPECKVVSGDLSIYKWNDLSTITFSGFGTYFTTKAKLEGWTDVTDETNEILALVKDDTPGYWTDGGSKESAPSMHYKTLYNSALSLYNNYLIQNVFG